ncbi:MAG: hypothetical protein CBB68_07935 [Rhodospirillaceae bacterium TMED8]|nr:phosphotransferase family protein [Magnetovibrio sp.]OUT50906.1 MAG: hypothetical protein CBB68_07935 [Rhodospirillaceae bacterium TMED8]|tara:strand:+ start:2658 stop:3749 length:1092 start_codon:yes stop_codon:yes gene_type:complete
MQRIDYPEKKYLTGSVVIPQDWERLASYLNRHNLSLDTSNPARQFAAGFGNLNYLISVNGRNAVLRRPPLGPIPMGGNDMMRESLIMRGLSSQIDLVPRCIHACNDIKVLGAPFFIMEFREGIVIGGEMPLCIAGWRGPKGEEPGDHLGRVLVQTLARLHRVAPAKIGLEQLGRPDGFLHRTREGWHKRAQIAWEGEVPVALSELLIWLSAQPIPDAKTALIHNDFKLDNLIVNPVNLEPTAMIDWDMGTRGDPLYDLAVLLSYWTEVGDPDAMFQMNQMPTASNGFISRQDAVRMYSELSKQDLSDFGFRRVLAILRTACIFRQLYRRYTSGGTRDPRYKSFGLTANGILEFGVDVANNRCF